MPVRECAYSVSMRGTTSRAAARAAGSRPGRSRSRTGPDSRRRSRRCRSPPDRESNAASTSLASRARTSGSAASSFAVIAAARLLAAVGACSRGAGGAGRGRSPAPGAARAPRSSPATWSRRLPAVGAHAVRLGEQHLQQLVDQRADVAPRRQRPLGDQPGAQPARRGQHLLGQRRVSGLRSRMGRRCPACEQPCLRLHRRPVARDLAPPAWTSTSPWRASGTVTRVGMPPPRSNSFTKSKPDSKSAAMVSEPESRTTATGARSCPSSSSSVLSYGLAAPPRRRRRRPAARKPSARRRLSSSSGSIEPRRLLDLLPQHGRLRARDQVLDHAVLERLVAKARPQRPIDPVRDRPGLAPARVDGARVGVGALVGLDAAEHPLRARIEPVEIQVHRHRVDRARRPAPPRA